MLHTKTIFAQIFIRTMLLVLLAQLCASFKTRPVEGRPLPAAVKPAGPEIKWMEIFDPARQDDSLSTAVPFNRIGILIVLKGVVDGVEGNFILDTGAPHLVLNQVYFRHYPVSVVSNEEHTSVSGTASAIQKTTVKNFGIGAMSYHHFEADLVDLGQIENSKGIKVLGLIGYELLKNCEMVIDYESGMVYFHRIGRREGAKYNSPHLQQAGFLTEEIAVQNNQVMLNLHLKGKKLKLVLDSGAETGILDSRLPESILNHVSIIGRMTIKGTSTKDVEALRGNANGLQLGANALEPMPVLIANLEHTCFSQNMGVHGVIGLHFMPLKKIGFNFVTRKMYLWK